MSYTSQLNAVTQLGRGIVGQILGNHYNVYRLGPLVTGSVVSGQPDVIGFQAKLQRAQRQAIEVQTFELEVFEAKCDNTTLRFGDVLVGTDPADLATYVFAQFRDFQPTLMVKSEFRAAIARVGGADGSLIDQPTSGAVTVDGWLGTTRASGSTPSSDANLVLTNGTYSFGSGTPALVPVGLSQTRRMRDSQNPQIPSAEYRDDYVAYVPLLPGITLQQLDRLNIENEGLFQIGSVFVSAQNTAMYGYILLLEKMPT